MTTALVTYASLKGSTAGIAGWIADELRAHGIDAWAVPAANVVTFESIDAAVIGSAVYFGRWMHEASDVVHKHAAELRRMPVWLFSSGPAAPPGDAAHVGQQDRLSALVGARGATVFGGALSHATDGPLEGELREFTAGDWRDEHRVRRWARDIAAQLEAVPARA